MVWKFIRIEQHFYQCSNMDDVRQEYLQSVQSNLPKVNQSALDDPKAVKNLERYVFSCVLVTVSEKSVWLEFEYLAYCTGHIVCRIDHEDFTWAKENWNYLNLHFQNKITFCLYFRMKTYLIIHFILWILKYRFLCLFYSNRSPWFRSFCLVTVPVTVT